jgi:hypothetical protein
MGRPQHHPRRTVRLECFLPTGCAQAPAIAGLQAGKAVLGNGRRKIVPAGFREFEKGRSHYRADRMTAPILATRIAAAIPEKTGHGPDGAALDRLTQTLRELFRPPPFPESSLSITASRILLYNMTLARYPLDPARHISGNSGQINDISGRVAAARASDLEAYCKLVRATQAMGVGWP